MATPINCNQARNVLNISMEINLNASNQNGRSPETESFLKRIFLIGCFSTAVALFIMLWGIAFTYSPYWLVGWTLFGMFAGGLSQHNSIIGRILNTIFWTIWYRMLVSTYERPPSGLVFLGALFGGLFFASLAAFIILSDHFFWLEMSRHTDAMLFNFIVGAIVGFGIYLNRRWLLSILEVSWIRISDKLVSAVKNNDLDQLSMLLSKGADINAKEIISDDTPLIAAAYYGYEKVVRFLIANGARVNKRGGANSSTALMVAAQQGHLDILKLLVDYGGRINDFDKHGISTLSFAAMGGNCDVMRELLLSDLNINDRCNNGRTALMMAASYGNLEAVKLLIEIGANIHIRCNRGNQALRYAQERGHLKIVQLLNET